MSDQETTKTKNNLTKILYLTKNLKLNSLKFKGITIKLMVLNLKLRKPHLYKFKNSSFKLDTCKTLSTMKIINATAINSRFG